MKIRSSVVLALSALLTCSALADKTSVFTFAGYTGYYQTDDSSATGVPVGVQIDDYVNDLNAAQTSSYASMGLLRSYAYGVLSSDGTPAPFLNSVGGYAGSTFGTTVIPAGGFGVGTLDTTVNIDGSLYAARTGTLEFPYLETWASYEVQVSLTQVGDPSSVQRRTQYGQLSADGSFSGAPAGAFMSTFDIVFGIEYALSVTLSSTASVMAPNSDPLAWTAAKARSDFSHTLTWGGARGYQGGSEVAGFSLYSHSGTDWSQPVPEPATMLALGAGLLPFLRRKKA